MLDRIYGAYWLTGLYISHRASTTLTFSIGTDNAYIGHAYDYCHGSGEHPVRHQIVDIIEPTRPLTKLVLQTASGETVRPCLLGALVSYPYLRSSDHH